MCCAASSRSSANVALPGDLAPLERNLTVEEGLRLNAEAVCAQAGDGWRDELACLMGCGVEDVGIGPVSRHRDSEPLDESNFRVVLRDLQSVDQRVRAERFRHWGFGWIEEIAAPLDNPAVVERIGGWVAALQAYAVASDDDLAELEAEYAAGSVELGDDEGGLDDDLGGTGAVPGPDPPTGPDVGASRQDARAGPAPEGPAAGNDRDPATGVRGALTRLDNKVSGIDVARPSQAPNQGIGL